MSDIAQLMRAANPVPDPAAALTDDEFDALLLLTRTRSGTMDVKQLETPGGQEKKKYRGWLVAAAAFAAVVVVGIGIGLVANAGSGASPDVIDTPTTTAVTPTTEAASPTTTQSATTTTLPPFTADEALAVSNAYFAAYEAGDVDAMLALFAPDLDLSIPGLGSLESWEELYTWKLAEGTVLTPSDCVTAVEDTGITVVCEYAHHQYPAILVGAPATAHTLTMTVTPNGSISGLRESFHGPAWVTDGPFASWVGRNHPSEFGNVECCGWASVEDARAAGLIRAQYAEEWVAYLEANGCTYTEGC